MKLYRIQTSCDGSWSIEWQPTQKEANSRFRKLVEQLGETTSVHLDEVEVPVTKTGRDEDRDVLSGRANVARALNYAHVNRDVWPGTRRLQYHNPHPATEAEDLLS